MYVEVFKEENSIKKKLYLEFGWGGRQGAINILVHTKKQMIAQALEHSKSRKKSRL